MVALVSIGLITQAYAYTPLTSTLNVGVSGTNVTNLQTLFADNSTIYPEKLVTGYFGSLTRMAVERFQVIYNIVTSGTPNTTGHGRVGPSTLAKINSIIFAGGWGGTTPVPSGTDVYAPVISNVTQNVSTNSVTLNWTTNENATGKVFYSTSPITLNEGDINSVGFGVINGNTATGNGTANTSGQVTISGLLSNTNYYYVIVSTDLSGNVSLYGVNNVFRTN
jgi:peptidoglycan hydrolase-like protein with peptidoglycan-binding domain